MALYKTINGKRTKITTREMKRTIMSVNGWTEEQYRKQYDLFKNKLRAYESYRGVHLGLTREQVRQSQQSPQELLYKQAKAKKNFGAAYEPSLQMQRILSFSAESITKGWKKAQDTESVYSKRRGEMFAAATSRGFADLIAQLPEAKALDEGISDPVKKEEALKALAEHIKAKQKDTGELFAGEQVGSDEAAADFDISQWLEGE